MFKKTGMDQVGGMLKLLKAVFWAKRKRGPKAPLMILTYQLPPLCQRRGGLEEERSGKGGVN